MSKDEKNKIIPIKNYVIYMVIVIVTIILTIFLCNLYKVRQNLIKENTIMSEFLKGVNEKEFENYVMENNNVIIYLASSKDETLKDFEIKFKQKLINYDLASQTIFIDLDNATDNFLNDIKNNYFEKNLQNINLGNYTNILVMENGKITSVLYNNKKDININDVDEFFYNRGVIGQA